jgi:glycosyltransferase involved in cell wall biosynthesis
MSHTIKYPNRTDTIVVVPCYNESQRIDEAAYERFLAAAHGVSLLLVDDGSTDATPLLFERLKKHFPAQLSTLRFAKNSGKAEAVRRGVLIALARQPEYVGYWDADLATPLEAIHDFRGVLLRRPEIRLTMGARVSLLGRQINRTGMRHILGRAFATAASAVLRIPVYDTQCGAKLFRVTPQLHEVFAEPFQTRWIFDVELLARLIATAPASEVDAIRSLVYEYPLERWEDVRGSRLKPRDFLKAALDLAGIHWRYMRGLRRKPGAVSGQPIELRQRRDDRKVA